MFCHSEGIARRIYTKSTRKRNEIAGWGAWLNGKIFRYRSIWRKTTRHFEPKGEESVSTIFNRLLWIIRFWNKFRMTTKCHAELSLIYFTIQILRYAQYDEKLLVILRAAPEESVLTIFINCMFKRFRNEICRLGFNPMKDTSLRSVWR